MPASLSKDKLLDDISAEELLRIAESSEPVASTPEPLNDVLTFISTLKIKPGNEIIKLNLLYSMYKKWSSNKLEQSSFTVKLRDYFDIQAGKIGIDSDSLKLTQKFEKLIKKKKVAFVPTGENTGKYEAFLKYYNIKVGTYWLLLEEFYSLYLYWVNERSIKSVVGEKTFNDYTKLYFKIKEGRVGVSKSILTTIRDYKNVKQETKS